MKSVKLAVFAVTLAAISPACDALAYVSKEIRDWSVGCSNGLTCSVSNWAGKGAFESVSLQRVGAPNAPVELWLRMGLKFNVDKNPEAIIHFAIDGKEALAFPVNDLIPDERTTAMILRDQARILPLIAAMEAGTLLHVSVTGGTGDTTPVDLRLSGVKAGLLFMDEVQDRLGRVDALVDKGTREPAKDFVAKDIKTLDDLPPIIAKDFTESGGACADLELEDIAGKDGFDISVGTTRLIGVPCGVGGAYNQPYALYVGYDVIFERISFPMMENGRPTTMSTAQNIDYDPVKKVMTSFFKGRGLADCGDFYKWEFGRDAMALDFLEQRSIDTCGEGNTLAPEDYPVVWKAKQ